MSSQYSAVIERLKESVNEEVVQEAMKQVKLIAVVEGTQQFIAGRCTLKISDGIAVDYNYKQLKYDSGCSSACFPWSDELLKINSAEISFDVSRSFGGIRPVLVWNGVAVLEGEFVRQIKIANPRFVLPGKIGGKLTVDVFEMPVDIKKTSKPEDRNVLFGLLGQESAKGAEKDFLFNVDIGRAMLLTPEEGLAILTANLPLTRTLLRKTVPQYDNVCREQVLDE
jgi:hypothetical protein